MANSDSDYDGDHYGKTGKCSLCEGDYANYGNNPFPLCPYNDRVSRCCDGCNEDKVIPERIRRTQEHHKNEARMKVAKVRMDLVRRFAKRGVPRQNLPVHVLESASLLVIQGAMTPDEVVNTAVGKR